MRMRFVMGSTRKGCEKGTEGSDKGVLKQHDQRKRNTEDGEGGGQGVSQLQPRQAR